MATDEADGPDGQLLAILDDEDGLKTPPPATPLPHPASPPPSVRDREQARLVAAVRTTTQRASAACAAHDGRRRSAAIPHTKDEHGVLVCDGCMCRFARHANLRRHHEQACPGNLHASNVGVYVCDVCAARYDSLAALMQHKAIQEHQDPGDPDLLKKALQENAVAKAERQKGVFLRERALRQALAAGVTLQKGERREAKAAERKWKKKNERRRQLRQEQKAKKDREAGK